MKRTISLLLIAAMLLMLFPLQIFAEETADTVITVQSTYANAGSTVTVNISIAGNTGILGTTLQLSYDEGLTLVDAAGGDALSYLTFTKPGSFTSPCNLMWTGQEYNADQAADGTMLTLTFQVAADAKNGSKLGVNITAEEGDTYDSDFNPIEVTVTNGTVSVIGYTPGDLDGNGKVNTKDVILLQRYLAGGYNITINKHAANVNNDTKYNTADLITLRRYVVGDYDVDTLYADPNPGEVSDWIPASDAPTNAQIVGRKWTYTQRNYSTGSSSSKSGWTLYNTARTSWGSTQGPVYSDPSNGSRNVWSEQYISGYDYAYSRSISGTGSGAYSTYAWSYYSTNQVIHLTYALSRWSAKDSNGHYAYGPYKYSGYVNTVWWNEVITTQYATRWYYQEPVYTYYFYQDVSGESDSCPTGDNISNVQEWVQYQD